jgi:signal transduction histidine kinase
VGDTQVELVVQDNGPGMPQEQLARLFTRTAQASHGSRRKASGLGLGLFIVHAIIAAHGGCITVASQVGEGTTFTVVLPLLVEQLSRA